MHKRLIINNAFRGWNTLEGPGGDKWTLAAAWRWVNWPPPFHCHIHYGHVARLTLCCFVSPTHSSIIISLCTCSEFTERPSLLWKVIRHVCAWKVQVMTSNAVSLWGSYYTPQCNPVLEMCKCFNLRKVQNLTSTKKFNNFMVKSLRIVSMYRTHVLTPKNVLNDKATYQFT